MPLWVQEIMIDIFLYFQMFYKQKIGNDLINDDKSNLKKFQT